MLKRLFIVNANKKDVSEIIIWWEVRRVLYNILLIAFCIYFLNPFSFHYELPGNLETVILTRFFRFLFLANLCYTTGWIFQLITHKNSNKFINSVKPWLFIFGTVLSITIEIWPGTVAKKYISFSDEEIEYLKPVYTKEKPAFKDIVGEYRMETISIVKLRIPDSLANKTSIRFNADSTFVLKNYPFDFGNQIKKDYKIINAKGTWNIDWCYNDYWTIPMTFEQTEIIGTNYIERTKVHHLRPFRIIRDQPPYKIYVTFRQFLAGGLILKKL